MSEREEWLDKSPDKEVVWVVEERIILGDASGAWRQYVMSGLTVRVGRLFGFAGATAALMPL